ncbi:unnamed protein product, partial [Amoebophrya sp. A120]
CGHYRRARLLVRGARAAVFAVSRTPPRSLAQAGGPFVFCAGPPRPGLPSPRAIDPNGAGALLPACLRPPVPPSLPVACLRGFFFWCRPASFAPLFVFGRARLMPRRRRVHTVPARGSIVDFSCRREQPCVGCSHFFHLISFRWPASSGWLVAHGQVHSLQGLQCPVSDLTWDCIEKPVAPPRVVLFSHRSNSEGS